MSSERRAAPWRWLAAVAPLALLHPGLRHAIESRMALHMLLEFPLLLASGWALARLLGRRGAWLDGLDAHALLGITVASCVSAGVPNCQPAESFPIEDADGFHFYARLELGPDRVPPKEGAERLP